MPQCAFKNCKNNYRNKNVTNGISYFRFPSDPFDCSEWISIVAKERQDEFFRPSKGSVICSVHFDQNEIIGHSKRRRLNKAAVPKYQIEWPSQHDVIKEEAIDKPNTPNLEIVASATSEVVNSPNSPTASVSDLIPGRETPRKKYLRTKLTL